MRHLFAVLCFATLAGCSTTPDARIPAAPTTTTNTVTATDDSAQTAPDCEREVKAIVRKYLPKALSYPPRSAHRAAYIDLVDAEYRAALIGASPLERALCGNALKYAVQEMELKAEDARGIR